MNKNVGIQFCYWIILNKNLCKPDSTHIPNINKEKRKRPIPWFSQSRFSLLWARWSSGGAEEKGLKGTIIYGAKLEWKKKGCAGKIFLLVLWVERLRWFINRHCFNVFSPCFLKSEKTEKWKYLNTCFQFLSQYKNWK